MHPLERPPVDVRHGLAFEEHNARKTMGLTLTEYEALPGTPDWIIEDGPQLSKCHVIAWSRLSNRIELVFTEASKKKR